MLKTDTTDIISIMICVLTHSPSDGTELPPLDINMYRNIKISMLGQDCKCSRLTTSRAWPLAASIININMTTRSIACALCT